MIGLDPASANDGLCPAINPRQVAACGGCAWCVANTRIYPSISGIGILVNKYSPACAYGFVSVENKVCYGLSFFCSVLIKY